MPELPEVETVRAGLARFVLDREIAAVNVDHPRAVRRHVPGSADFRGRLVGRRILSAERRGKYLWLPLDSGETVLAHLGMSGQLLVQPDTAPLETHLRVRIRFADGGPELRFVDQRTFGGLSVEPMTEVDGTVLPVPIAHIARDPLDPRFSAPRFVAAMRRKRTELKRALLDQSLISGIGNIYADEALWVAKLHYARPTENLPPGKIREVLAASVEVMTAALAAGGTSFDSLYVNVNGASGYFDRSLQAYGREDKPCGRCGTPIRREPFMNRSSYFCPHCQRRPYRAAPAL
ncbi:MAG TPA: bifunctional DNA-formamidopyrimidine glycosylase/DNA-(apurinic or apyrimidinic site) lyase [Sporichthyaceae bacterium]